MINIFLLGVLVGWWAGFITFGLATISRRSDDEIEQEYQAKMLGSKGGKQ